VWTGEEGGYEHLQATKPSTIGAALHDSPAGLAAWIGEKAVAWSSTTHAGQPAFDRDVLLSILTLYWVTGTITSSMQPYWVHTQPQQRPATRRPVSRPQRGQRVRRGARPVSQAAPRTGRALLHLDRLERARPGRALLGRACALGALGYSGGALNEL
jgi:hypothetical protein